jgi:uncharacterized low-complexity protein
MSNNNTLNLAMGAILVGGLALASSNMAQAFQLTDLQGGYQLIADEAQTPKMDPAPTPAPAEDDKSAEGSCGGDKSKEGSCGEGKCGGEAKKEGEGSCGGNAV